jgi:hypothetical protein
VGSVTTGIAMRINWLLNYFSGRFATIAMRMRVSLTRDTGSLLLLFGEE